jgi:uncharacterized membrane protein
MKTNQLVIWATPTTVVVMLAAYAGIMLGIPASRSPLLQVLLDNTPTALTAHIASSAVALIAGASQGSAHIRTSFAGVHKWLGRVYVLAVAIGGSSGLRLAVDSDGGLVAHTGFGMLAVCWVGTTLVGYYCARSDDQSAHRRWMIRSFSLTLAGVVFRLYLPSMMAAGLDFETAYPIVSWLCWVPNLLLVEWKLWTRDMMRSSAKAKSSETETNYAKA